MATQKEIDDLLNLLDNISNNVTPEFNDLGKKLTDEEIAAKKRQREKDARDKHYREKMAESAARWSRYGSVINSSMSSMTTQQGAFNAMGATVALAVKTVSKAFSGIPFVGPAIKGLGEAGAETIKLLTEQTGMAFAEFNKLSGSGVVSSFKELREASKESRLTYQALGTILTKNSEGLAIFGGSAIEGSRKMQQVLNANKDQRDSLMALGVSIEEFADIQVGYVTTMARSGISKETDTKKIAKSAKEYAVNLTVLSQLTGKTRQDLQKQRDKLMNDARFRAKLTELRMSGDEAQAKELEEALQTLPEGMAEGFKDYIAGGGVAITEAGNSFAMMLGDAGVDASKVAQDLSNKQATVGETISIIANASKTFTENNKEVVSVIGADSPFTKFFVEASNLALLAGKNFSEMKDELRKNAEATMKKVPSIVKVANSANEMAVDIGYAATGAERLMKINAQFGDQIKNVVDYIASKGGPTPGKPPAPPPPAPPPVSSTAGGAAMVGPRGSRRPSVGAASMKPKAENGQFTDEEIMDMIKHHEGVRYYPYKDSLGLWTVGVGHLIGDGKTLPPEYDRQFSEEEVMNLFKKDYEHHKNAAQTNIPGFSKLSSAGQAAMIDLTFNMGPAWIKKWPTLQAQLSAGDIQGAADNLEKSKWYEQVKSRGPTIVGLLRSAVVQAANGAVIEPTSGGTLTQIGEAGQTEAVIPMRDSKGIPVDMNNSASTNELKLVFDRINNQFDSIIDILTTDNNVKRNIVVSTA